MPVYDPFAKPQVSVLRVKLEPVDRASIAASKITVVLRTYRRAIKEQLAEAAHQSIWLGRGLRRGGCGIKRSAPGGGQGTWLDGHANILKNKQKTAMVQPPPVLASYTYRNMVYVAISFTHIIH